MPASTIIFFYKNLGISAIEVFMTIEDFGILWAGFHYIFIWMSGLWVLHFVMRNTAIVDIGSSLSVLLAAYVYFIKTPYINIHESIVLIVVGLWALRFSSYHFVSRIFKKEEGRRYQDLRKKWKKWAGFKYFWLFQAHAIFSFFLSIPFFLLAMDARPNEWYVFIGALVCLLATCGEAIADLQLKSFQLKVKVKVKTNVNTQVCRDGLWKYSPRSNYFFKLLFWVGVAVMGQGADHGYLSWLSPVLFLSILFWQSSRAVDRL